MYAYSFFIFTSFGWLIWAAFGSSCCSQKQPSCSQQQPSSKQAAGGCAAIRLLTELQPAERLDEACRIAGLGFCPTAAGSRVQPNTVGGGGDVVVVVPDGLSGPRR